MRKIYLLIVILGCLQINANAQNKKDSLRKQINERLITLESGLSKLTKIKFSGYIQAQFENFENKAVYPSNSFSLRRTRLKATYKATDGIKFVLQSEMGADGFSLKDAYVVLNDHWIKNGFFSNALSLTAGKFNRLNYEVEYSSSRRELPERSNIIRAIYLGERAIGFKLEAKPKSIPLKIQLALFNGNDGGLKQFSDTTGKTSSNKIENEDYDNFKDIMARATYSFKLGSLGKLDIGAHTYLGSLKSNSNATLRSDYTSIDSSKVGDALKRNWFGAEFQFFANVLGGLSVKGEYITGKNAILGGSGFANGNLLPNFQNNFAGYYLYFIKDIGKKNQFAFRYDYYDPNTDITGSDIEVVSYTGDNAQKIGGLKSSKLDLAYTTFTFAWHYHFDNNIKVSLAYAIVQNEKVGKNATGVGNLTESYTNPDGTIGTNDYSTVFKQNMLTLRLQAKF